VDTSQPDPEAAIVFYGDLFGWEFQDVMPPGSPVRYYMARLRGGDVAAIGSPPEGAPATAVWNTYVWVQSADETAAKVREAGGRTLTEPFDVMDSGRMAVFADPEGAVFSAWQARNHKGARIVNEAGSVNFNGLNTRDVEAAKRFYGSVFGWQTLTIGGAELWTLPGYGDHLEERDPGLRQRTAEFGTPGFEDVVATINPIPAEQGNVPAHWSVTSRSTTRMQSRQKRLSWAAGYSPRRSMPPGSG
jgi:predicted enzyme related to lactoylglutathione lyase